MRVFVLTTGRSGSTTLYHACQHIENYTVQHEGATHWMKDNHITIDNRLSFRLGHLQQWHDDKCFYFHLIRDVVKTAKSFQNRLGDYDISQAWAKQVLMKPEKTYETCLDYVLTTNANIQLFLKDKPHEIINLNRKGIETMYDKIGVIGNINKSLQELKIKYNATK